MTEKEMKETITAVLRKRIQQVLIPATLGVGMILSSGCSDDTTTLPKYASIFDKGISKESNVSPLYSAQLPDKGVAGELSVKYAAPFDQGTALDTTSTPDKGTVVKYAAPFDQGTSSSDKGTAVKYQASFPDAKAKDSVLLYATSFPADGLKL